MRESPFGRGMAFLGWLESFLQRRLQMAHETMPNRSHAANDERLLSFDLR